MKKILHAFVGFEFFSKLKNSKRSIIYTLLSCLCLITQTGLAATIFSENMGAPSATTLITANSFQNAATLTYSNGGATNSAECRNTSPSTGYTGASGTGNVFFTGTSGNYGFSIESINTSAYTSLSLQFAYRKESASVLPTIALDYWNGTAWVNLPFSFSQTATAGAGWYLSPAIALPVAAQINGLKLRWVKSGGNSTRLDDVVLTGSSAPATPTTTSISPSSTTEGSAGFTLTVNGTNFVSGSSTVTWNGATRTTTFVSATQLTATITAADVVAAGTATVGVTTTGAAAVSNTQTFTINAASSPTLLVTPSSLSFGNQNVATSSTGQSFSLSGTNLTGGSGNITVTVPSTDFEVSNNNSTWGATTTIAFSGATLTATPVYVRFSPQATGAKSGNITLSGGGASVPPTVALTGTGVVATLTTSVATVASFGSQNAGTQSVSKNFTLSGTNLTGAPSTITVTAPSTDFEVSNDNIAWGATTTIAYSSATLAATTVYVRFTPQAPSGAKSGNITFSGGGASSTPTVAVSGTSVVVLAVPVATTATSITNSGFTANWGAVANATGYFLDVSTSPTFGTAATATASETFDPTMPASYSTGTYSLITGNWDFIDVVKGTGTNAYAGLGCQLKASTGIATSPSYSKISTFKIYAKAGVTTTSMSVSKIVNGGTPILLQTISLTGGGAFTQYTIAVNETSTDVKI
ncbi:MAG: hypothetical protein RLZZ292_3329, partial [Bacteroidota bacterium]